MQIIDAISVPIEVIKVNGTTQNPVAKVVDISALTREIDSVPSASTSVITLNVDNYVQVDTNTGATDVTIAFQHLPVNGRESTLIVKNGRVAAFNLVLPTAPIVSGGITYTFASLVVSPMVILNGGSCEVNFLFVFSDATHCEIRMTGLLSV